MSTGARIALLVFAVLYSAWTIWVSRLTLTQRRVSDTSDPRLTAAARKYRFMTYVRLAIRAAIAFFAWAYLLLAPIASETAILLAIPIMLAALVMVVFPILWRDDLRHLHDSALLQ